MHNLSMKYNLQLFADGVSGESEANASAGVMAVDAEQQAGVTSAAAGQNEVDVTRNLEALGVPKAEAEKYRALKGIKASAEPTAQVTAEPAAQAETNADNVQQTAAAEDKAKGLELPDWDVLKKDPKYSQHINETVRNAKKAVQSRLDAIAPAMEMLGRLVGIDASDLSKLDFAKFNDAILEKESFYEEGAASTGENIADYKNRTQRELNISSRERQQTAREQQFMDILTEATKRNHEAKVQREVDDLKKKFPHFDFAKELEDPRFARMIEASGGLSVEQAYYALHHNEIEKMLVEQTAAKASQALSKSVQAGRRVAPENGSAGRAAVPVGQRKYSQMKTPEERAIFEANLKNGKFSNFV
jgi:hypothetical protein